MKTRARINIDSIRKMQFRIVKRLCAPMVLAAVLLSTNTEEAIADVPQVPVTYHGVKTHQTFSSGPIEADAWTSGDIVFYAPQGRVSQAIAEKWVPWYVHVDNLYRRQSTIDFNSYRLNDPNFGSKKVISFGENCGAGCGTKQMAEADLGYLDAMVADPDNYALHWIFFYEMGRGGRREGISGRAMWPSNAVLLPHTMAAMALHELGGDNAVLNADAAPKALLKDLDRWEASDHKWNDIFVEQFVRVQNGWTAHDLATAMLMRIMVETNIGTVIRIMKDIATKERDPSTALQAMCDWRNSINQATNNRFNDRMVNQWGMPSNCEGAPAANPVVATPSPAAPAPSRPVAPAAPTPTPEPLLAQNYTCQLISDNRGTHHGITWGSATGEERAFWIANSCNTAPTLSAEAARSQVPANAIISLATGQCVDIHGFSSADGANAMMWNCHNRGNQLVRQMASHGGGVTLQLAHSNKCLDAAGDNILQWTCHGGSNQKFNWDGAQLRDGHYGQCLTIQGGNVALANCENRPEQQFRTGS